MKRYRIFLASIGFSDPINPLASPPMGMLYLAAYLRSKFNTDICIVNQKLDNLSNELLVRRIADFNPDIVGFSAMTPTAHHLPYLTQKTRLALPKSLILLGGPHVSASGAETLKNTDADAAVSGEGELVFEQIIHEHFEGGDLKNVPGIFWKGGDKEIITNPGSSPMIEDLDSLPFPAFDLIDLPAYWKRQSSLPVPRRSYIPLFSSRGCPYKCIYCHRVFGKTYRKHSAERIVDEIQYFQSKYGFKDVDFFDDTFNLSKKRLFSFCDLAKKINPKVGITFPNGIRTDILNEESIDALVEAGLWFGSFALESGSPRIQKKICKHLDIPRFIKNIERAASKGVFSHGFVMFGFPTETEEDMQQTVDILCRTQLHTCSIYTATPYPNTGMYREVLNSHPEKLARLRYEDTYYAHAQINFSDVPDDRLFYYQRKANQRFFMNPKRIFRIVRDFPKPFLLPLYIPEYLKRATKGFFGRG